MIKKTFRILTIAFVLLTCFVLGKTFLSESRQVPGLKANEISINDSAIFRLQKAIQFKTISWGDSSGTGNTEFEGFHSFLRKSFPGVFSTMETDIHNNHALLLKWKGVNDKAKPLLLLAHQDVVIANDKGWEYPPFSGAIENGFIWGRGTLDDKGSLMAILEACELLISEGFLPKINILLAFGDDEEINGNGAKCIANQLKSENIQPWMIIDEGLVITQGIVPMTNKAVALIGTSEKGYLSLKISTKSDGGHSSTPVSPNAIELLSKNIRVLCEELSDCYLCEPVDDFLSWLGPELRWPEKIIFANRWGSQTLINKIYQQTASGKALVCNTCTPTVFISGKEDNVVPGTASAILNLRLLPGSTIEHTLRKAKELIDSSNTQIEISGNAYNPARVSPTNSKAFRYLAATTATVFPESIVMPNLMLASSDSRNFNEISSHIFRFAPYRLNKDDVERIHGVNERIQISDYLKMPVFYYHLIKNIQEN